MLWLLAYLIVGMLYVSITTYPIVRKVAQQYKNDDVYLIATFIISIAFIICLIPFWIIILTFDIAKLFYKWRGKLHE
ncbi:hypothetical protein [Bacillus bingmayongensis]|uniref:hypothetical protein n=1 Tax=Bacillus bingmayongensis TaxID=1150157 RepID=UPI0002EFE15E|nr:hypothetical protein [Bacillus bingmayongensis]